MLLSELLVLWELAVAKLPPGQAVAEASTGLLEDRTGRHHYQDPELELGLKLKLEIVLDLQ